MVNGVVVSMVIRESNGATKALVQSVCYKVQDVIGQPVVLVFVNASALV